MIGDLDIYRSAKLLIDQHGNEAPIHAVMRRTKRRLRPAQADTEYQIFS